MRSSRILALVLLTLALLLGKGFVQGATFAHGTAGKSLVLVPSALRLWLDPAVSTLANVGDTTMVTMTATDVEGFNGLDLALGYDPAVVEAVLNDSGNPVTAGECPSADGFFVTNNVNPAGQINYAGTMLGGEEPAYCSNGVGADTTIGSVMFRCLVADGSSTAVSYVNPILTRVGADVTPADVQGATIICGTGNGNTPTPTATTAPPTQTPTATAVPAESVGTQQPASTATAAPTATIAPTVTTIPAATESPAPAQSDLPTRAANNELSTSTEQAEKPAARPTAEATNSRQETDVATSVAGEDSMGPDAVAVQTERLSEEAQNSGKQNAADNLVVIGQDTAVDSAAQASTAQAVSQQEQGGGLNGLLLQLVIIGAVIVGAIVFVFRALLSRQ